MNYHEIIKSKDYSFLRTDDRLKNMLFIGVGGSHAYGTNIEGSDLDIRGCAMNSRDEILLGRDFEQVTDNKTDTTIYSFKKLIGLLTNCNPNVIEMFGLKPEHYLYMSYKGRILLDNKDLFLSQKAASSFGGYANQQLRRLENYAARRADQPKQEEHILQSVQNVQQMLKEKGCTGADKIKLYIDHSDKEDMDSEIFFDVDLSHCAIRDFNDIYGELSRVVREYSKLGSRNSKAIEHNKLTKHAMHLVRLYYTCFDILEKGEIITYRENEHDLLMEIRNGKYVNEHNQPTEEFFEMIEDLEKRLEYAKANTNLPVAPDQKKIDEFVKDINYTVVKA